MSIIFTIFTIFQKKKKDRMRFVNFMQLCYQHDLWWNCGEFYNHSLSAHFFLTKNFLCSISFSVLASKDMKNTTVITNDCMVKLKLDRACCFTKWQFLKFSSNYQELLWQKQQDVLFIFCVSIVTWLLAFAVLFSPHFTIRCFSKHLKVFFNLQPSFFCVCAPGTVSRVTN